jgi:hypothetical protein
MAVNIYDHDAADFEPPPGRWDFLFSWTTLFLVGCVLYELTAQAFLGVTIFCCKLGWEDFRTGIWLRHKDPVSARGKMELWIYIASGLWRTAISAFCIMLVLAIVAARMGLPAPDELEEAGLTASIGFTVSVLTTMRALGLAMWHRRKLWLHPALHESRKDNLWPPVSPGSGPIELYSKNKAGTLIIFSITAISFPLAFIGNALTAPFVAVGVRAVLLALFTFLAYPVLILWMRDYQRRHVLAHRPEDCWGADAVVSDAQI